MPSSAVLSVERLGFPFETDSPFLFAVYHLDRYPAGDANMGPGRKALAGRALGSDFSNPCGWSMYHGEQVPGFPKHPHRGFETLTVARQGYIDHTDSMGCAARFGDGDAQWMTAGRGISHAEMFPLLNQQGDNLLELFQIWINLPKRSKMVPPSFKMLWSEDLQVAPQSAAAGGADVALIVGELPGFGTPPAPPPDSYATDPAAGMLVLTIKLAAGASWVLPGCAPELDTKGMHRNLYFYAGGSATIDGRETQSGRRIKLKPGVAVDLAAGPDGGVEYLLLQGLEIPEPVVQHGPFVGNSREDISKAFRDYQQTGFGTWPWPSDSLAHERGKERFAKFEDGKLEERPMHRKPV